MKYILLLYPVISIAGFSELESQNYAYEFIEDKKNQNTRIRPERKGSQKNTRVQDLLEKLEANDTKVNNILKKAENSLNIRKKGSKLRALSRIKGTLFNSVLATNLKATTMLVRFEENDYFVDAELRCEGISFGKRVQAKCDLISGDREYIVEAELWDLDGAEGIKADKFYDGSEKKFLTSSFSSFFSGVLSASKDKVMTPYGELAKTSDKNKALSGLYDISQNVSRLVKNSSDNNIQVALINSNREVYVFFNKGVNL